MSITRVSKPSVAPIDQPVAMEGEVVSMETTQADGKVLAEGGEALMQAPQGEVAGNMEMMVMDALDPTLLQMKSEVLEGGGTVTVTGGDDGQIITLQVCGQHRGWGGVGSSVIYEHTLNMLLFWARW